MNHLTRNTAFVLLATAISGWATFKVYGEIGKKYQSLGGPSGFLGDPLTDELGTPDGVGRFSHFQGGSIYWSPQTQACEVHGAIPEKWAAMGWERSYLGYPISDESAMGDGLGRYSNFQGGSIFWSPKTGPHAMHSAIMPKWIRLGGPRSFLGYPVSDDVATPGGRGRFVHFEGGSIYWSPQTGAHEVHGFIGDKWASLSWERGRLGFPISDEHQDGPFRRSNFERGYIRWSATTGSQVGASTSFDNGTALNPVRE
jgi:uncharacterized protein with LGFP repeats